MKTIKAWAVFGKYGDLIRETIDDISETDSWARFCAEFGFDFEKHKKHIEGKGFTCKPITISWEEK